MCRIWNEITAAKKIKKKNGSYVHYFNGVFTQLELTNLACNLVFLLLRLTSFYLPERRNFNVAEASREYPDVTRIAYVESLELCVRACSILTASWLFFKYLTLMPKTTSWYLTGTTLYRGGREFKSAGIMLTIFGSAWAIVFEHYYGDHLEEFSSFLSSCMAIFQMLLGSTSIVQKCLRSRLHTDRGLSNIGVVLYIGLYSTFALCILPLFLAIMRDAYAVRSDQVMKLRQRIKCVGRTFNP